MESTVYKQVWVDLDVLVGDGRIRVNFVGPFAKGAVLYDKVTSSLILVDGFDKYIVPVTKTDRAAVKWMGVLGGGGIKSAIEGSQPSVKMAYQLASDNACALLNGEPELEQKATQKNGFTCDLYRTVVSEKTKREVWMVTPRITTLSQDDYATLLELRDLMLDLGRPILKEMGVNGSIRLRDGATPQLPVLIGLYTGGKESGRFIVHKVRPKALTASDFEPPAGYKRMGFLDLIQEGM